MPEIPKTFRWKRLTNDRDKWAKLGLEMIREYKKVRPPAAFPKALPIFQQPFSLLESALALAVIAFRAAGKSGKNFPAASKFAGKPFQQGSSDSHSLLEFSDFLSPKPI